MNTIITYPDPILNQKCLPVTKVDKELISFTQEMLRIIHVKNALGLAANQLGKSIRVIALNDELSKSLGTNILINPVISRFKKLTIAEEGCLSFPTVTLKCIRPNQLNVNGYSLDGIEIKQTVNGLLARCIHHEVDHLDGLTILDRQRKMV